jgi:hypothetical protein
LEGQPHRLVSEFLLPCRLPAFRAARNHGDFVNEVVKLTNEWKKAGLITGAQKGAIQSCAASASIPQVAPAATDANSAVAGGQAARHHKGSILLFRET